METQPQDKIAKNPNKISRNFDLYSLHSSLSNSVFGLLIWIFPFFSKTFRLLREFEAAEDEYEAETVGPIEEESEEEVQEEESSSETSTTSTVSSEKVAKQKKIQQKKAIVKNLARIMDKVDKDIKNISKNLANISDKTNLVYPKDEKGRFIKMFFDESRIFLNTMDNIPMYLFNKFWVALTPSFGERKFFFSLPNIPAIAPSYSIVTVSYTHLTLPTKRIV